MGLVLPQTVKVKWGGRNKNYYTNKGYVFTKLKDEFEVDVRDLTKSNKLKLKCVCDGCGEITYKFNDNLTKELEKDGKLYCIKCKGIRSRQTWLKKYGVENPSQLKEIKEKKKQTCKKNYGVEHPSQSKEIQEKKKQTCKKNYGVESFFQLKEFQEKQKQTCKEKYGVECFLQSKEFQEKKKQTCKEKYGVESPMQSKEFQEKKKQTCKEKYGVENPMQLKEFREKQKQTFKEKYGVEHPMQLKEFQEKQKQTFKEKYGVESPMQLKEFREKALNLKIKRYGTKAGNFFIPGSKSQKYIHKLVGGQYNYYFYGSFLDIAFVKDKIAIEYDGTGHKSGVKCYKKYTEKQYKEKEQNRENKLFEEGWKIIRLVNEKTDKLPDDKTIVNLINEKIHILKTTDTKKVVVKWS